MRYGLLAGQIKGATCVSGMRAKPMTSALAASPARMIKGNMTIYFRAT
jgi:hypothetical protein